MLDKASLFIIVPMLVTASIVAGASALLQLNVAPAFITVVTTGGTYTHEEYHDRGRVQLKEWGRGTVCDWHLGNIVRPNHALEVWQDQDKEAIGNAWRTIEVYTEECNDVSSGRRPLS